MKKGQAVRPKFVLPNFIQEKKAESKDATEEEQQLAGMSRSAGWKILRDYIDEMTTGLDGINETAISQGGSFADIGRNTVVINLAKSVIKKIVDKVEDAKEACERREEPRGKGTN
jgi:hypothetical protein